MSPEALGARLNVSRGTIERLGEYQSLVEKWTRRINLVSRRELQDFWNRHIADSLGLWLMAPPCTRWVDLGSGGGLPVLPIAIVAREKSPDMRVIAVESDQRKAAFLREAARRTEVALDVRCDRSEALHPLRASVVSARALAPLDGLLSLAERHVAKTGVAVFLKGDKVHAELTEAAQSWHIRYQYRRHPLTQRGHILRIDRFARIDK